MPLFHGPGLNSGSIAEDYLHLAAALFMLTDVILVVVLRRRRIESAPA